MEPMHRRRLQAAGQVAALAAALALLPLLTGCSQDEPGGPPACGAGEELYGGRCGDPATRYEPAERVDFDNVVAYGDPISQLNLPEPPRSGFRLIAPPRAMEPGEEAQFCLSWPYPALQNKTVYAARVHATPGLHHSNVIAKPVDPALGPNPYPGCHLDAADPFGALPAVIPDVLFASSTQVVGQETLAFPPGMGFILDTSREVSTDIHLLNPSGAPLIAEVVYDFFTMPEGERAEELVPFVMNVNDFRVPPHATQTVGTTCPTFGGDIVSLMPHTHHYAEAFDVDVVGPTGGAARVYEGGAFDLESDIRVYEPSIALTSDDSIQYGCAFRNTTDHDLVFGLGDNEMCTLFGYLYPPEKQFVAYSEYQGEPCKSFQIGIFR